MQTTVVGVDAVLLCKSAQECAASSCRLFQDVYTTALLSSGIRAG